MLYLASRSPRRRQLLEQVGIDYRTIDIDVPEQIRRDESPQEYVARVAHDKATEGLRQCVDGAGAFVLGADTEVVLGEEVFGKPTDARDAARMLRMLSGGTHRVISCICLVGAHLEAGDSCTSEVRFAPLTEAAIQAYIDTGEPFGKAGAYAIQGRAAAFVEHLSGSYSGVMGLPLFETMRLLEKCIPGLLSPGVND